MSRLSRCRHRVVGLGADQQVGLRSSRAVLDEQVEEIGLAVHHAHHAGLGQWLGRLRAVAQPLDPTERLALGARLRARLAFRLGVRGRVEGGPQHAQRHPVGIDGQGRVQLQAARQAVGRVAAETRAATAETRAATAETRTAAAEARVAELEALLRERSG